MAEPTIALSRAEIDTLHRLAEDLEADAVHLKHPASDSILAMFNGRDGIRTYRIRIDGTSRWEYRRYEERKAS